MSELSKLVGERLRNYRKDRGMSQEELSDRAELHSTYISALERGVKSPTLDTLDKLAGALEISFEELLQYIHPTSAQIEKTTTLAEIVGRLQTRTLREQRLVLKALDVIFELADGN